MTTTQKVYVDTLSNKDRKSVTRLIKAVGFLKGWKIKAAEGHTMKEVIEITAPIRDLEAVSAITKTVNEAALIG